MPDMTADEKTTYYQVTQETIETLSAMKRPAIIDYMYANHADGPYITTMRKAEMVKAIAHRVAGNKITEMRRAERLAGIERHAREPHALPTLEQVVAGEPVLQELFTR